MGDHINRAFNLNVYRDQVDAITNWFNSWNECEQTVVLFSLIKRLSLKQTKFVMIVLEQSLAFNSNQLSSLENLANDSEHLKIIDTRDLSTVFQLLSLLPLLRPGNTEAAMIFTEIIPQCVNVCLEQSKNLEESRQLISYALIHPALSSDQRSCLSSLLLILDQKCNAHTYSSEKVSRLDNLAVGKVKGANQLCEKEVHESAVISSRGSASEFTDNRSSVESVVNSHAFELGAFGIRDMQTNQIPLHNPVSATMSAPPSLMGSTGFYVSNLHTSQAGNGTTTFNMATPPTPLSTSPDYDSSYGGSTGSLVETCENTSGVMATTPVPVAGKDRSGMKDVPAWLKSLRLHKYSAMFSKFSYEEMLALDDAKLCALGVTKGARHKIVLSVAKLNDRGKELRQMEKDAVESGGNVKHLLTDLKNMMNTPIKYYTVQLQHIKTCNERKPSHSSVQSESWTSKSPPSHSNSDESESSCNSSDDQNASQNQTLTFESNNTPDNIPDLVCNLLGILCSQILLHPDEDNCSNYIHLLDRCYCHEAFTIEQKQKVSQWRIQCQRLSRSSNLRTLGGNSSHNNSGRRPSYPSNGRSSPFYCGSNQKFGVGVFMGSNPLPVASNGPNNAAVGSGRFGVSNISNSRPFTPHGRSNSISGVAFGHQRFQNFQQCNGSTSFGAGGALASASFANTNNKAYVSSYMAEQQQSNLYPFSCTPTPVQGGSASHQQVQYQSTSHSTANCNSGQHQHHRSNSSNNDNTGPLNANCFNVQHSSLNALPSVGHHSVAGHQLVNPGAAGAVVVPLPKVPSNHKPLLRTQSAGSAGGAFSALSVFTTNAPEPHNSSSLSSVVTASSAAAQYFSHRAVANNNASNFYNSFANNNPVACNIRNDDATEVSGAVVVDNGSGAASRVGGGNGNLSGTVSVGQNKLNYSGMSCVNPVGATGAAGVNTLVGAGPGAGPHQHHQQGPHPHRRRLSPSLSSAYEAASATSVDSISSLESLCRSVADHALNANSDHMSPTPSSLIAE